MSDEAHHPASTPQRARKPVKKPGAQPRPRSRAKDGATGKTGASPRAPISVVPEIPAAPAAAPARRASAARLAILTTTLALMIGGLAWFSETPELSRSEPFQIALGSPARATDAAAEPLTPHVRQGIEQELRLAAIALEIRESQESLARLWNDARSLASSIGTLASGVESLKADVDAVRSDASAGLARIEDRLHMIEVAAAPEPLALGDPALREATLLGYPEFAHAEPEFANAEPAITPEPTIAQADEPVQPATTGGLPEIAAPPEATVKVSFAKPRPRIKAPKPIGGWLVHNVRDDLALVEGDGAHYEVRAGELLPGPGIVRAIKKRGERWVVPTSKGVITEPK